MEDRTDSPADPTLAEINVRELLERLASKAPIPGGGSAAALGGAMGAALVAMVAELTIGRPDAEEHAEQLERLRNASRDARDQLLALAEEDSRAYAAVVAARRLPRDTDEQRALRAEGVRRSMRAAADVPLRAARAAEAALQLAREMAPIGNPNAVSDAGVAAQLLAAAVRGAILNVQINLPYLAEGDPLAQAAPAELGELAAAAQSAEAETLAVVNGRIGPS
jgi:formiminotetrahydrofolate cyclodeaminase